MAEIIKPKDLNSIFLKKIEDKHGKINFKDDFFSGDLDTYYKADDPSKRGEGGGITHTIIKLPSFVELFKNLDQARNSAKTLTRNPELKGDTEFTQQADQIYQIFNSFRTFFRKNYPNQYSTVRNQIKEMTTTAAGGSYLTKYAFGKNPASQYIKMGYKPVNQKTLRKKSKGIDYVDLYKK